MAVIEEEPTVDCLIIGGGIAGVSTALSLVRTLHTAVLFDDETYRNASTPHLATIPTWDTQDPIAYLEQGKINIMNKYSTVEMANVSLQGIERITAGANKGLFRVRDNKQHTWLGRKVVLAMGVEDIFPDIPGFAECWVSGIFHCLVHRGYEERGCSSAGILAINGDATFMAARHLAFQARNLTENVTVYTDGNEALAAQVIEELAPSGFRANASPIKSFNKGLKRSEVTIHFEDGTSETSGFLVHRPLTQIRGPFAQQLGVELAAEGHIRANFPFNETSIPGVFVAGDAGSQFRIGTQAIAMGAFAAGGVQMQINTERWSEPSVAES